MTILCVQNNSKKLAALADTVSRLSPDAEILRFTDSPKALAAAREHEIDIAFLDMGLQELTAQDLGQYLKDLYPFVNLIFLTGRRQDAYEAMQLRASGCLLHSSPEEDMRRELTDLRYPVGQNRPKRAFAQTFGNFESFVDGRSVAFKYSRSKEILALLINNRGAQTTNGEIIASLWEDDGDPEKKSSYLSNLRQDLNNTLTRLKLTDIIVKQRGSMAVAADRIECDLFDWLKNRQRSRYQYLGDYMNQYSWAEYMHAELDEISYSFEE